MARQSIQLATVCLAALALLCWVVDHRRSIEKLCDDFGPQPRSTAAVIGVLVSIVGLLLLTATLSDQ